jgi:hypothetical protein
MVVRDVRNGNAVVDLAAARVIRVLSSAGVETILLKGPATRLHLYGSEPRHYVDVDLLIPPTSWSAAVEAIEAMGCHLLPSWSDMVRHAVTWRDPDGIGIDLHRRLGGARVEDGVGWDVLFDRSQTTNVASTCVRIPTRPATLAIVALHAAHHGAQKRKPLVDLARAFAVADLDEWRQALGIAERLGAREPFSAGLRLAPDGARLCRELALEPPTRARVRLQAATAEYAAAIAELRELSPAARRTTIVRLLFPSQEKLAKRPWTHRLAARRATIPLAWGVRWLRAGWLLIGAVRPYVRARRFEETARRR